MTDPKAKIAARIKEAREWKGLTQVHMAQQLKVARQTYLDLETGKTEPKVRLLTEISAITERGVIDKIPRSRRWKTSPCGRRLTSAALLLHDQTLPDLLMQRAA